MHADPLVIIWAPFGRDAVLAQHVLRDASIESIVCNAVQEVGVAAREENAGVALLAEEALDPQTIKHLREALDLQPRWSDLPLILMTGGGTSTNSSLHRLRLMRVLGNITLLERPLRGVTLVAAVQGALTSRARQFDTRDYLQGQAEMQAKLEQANADLKQFAFAASHDLQEPLRTVKIFSKLLLERFASSDDPQAQEFAGYVQQGVTRMESLLRDLLLYSRAIHQDRVEKPAKFSLVRPLEKAIESLRVEIDNSRAEIEINPLPSLSGDEIQLSLVFQNLVGNSLKYRNPDIVPKIRISADTEDGFVYVRVSDNGIGFEQKYAERVFELFQRLSNTSADGTGLGLALSRRIVEKHGGRIFAESQPEVGSTFTFTLPLQTKIDESDT